MTDPTFDAVCDDCGAQIRENHMGQSIHRCDYKKRSRVVADRLVEVLVENPDYYLMGDTEIVLTLYDAAHKFRYTLCYDSSEVDGLSIPVGSIETRPVKKFFKDREKHIVDIPEDGTHRISFVGGYRGWTKILESEDTLKEYWVTDVEVDRDV